MTAVYCILKDNAIPAELTHRLTELLPPSEREELARLRNADARADFALGRLLLRYALRKDRGIEPAEVAVARAASGKPYLTKPGGIHFSITHTGSCVACAVSDCPVGLDAETVTDRDHSRVVRRMFTHGERDFAAGDPERFFRIWTMKESYAKLTGDGLSRSFADFDVLDGTGTGGAVFTAMDIGGAVACVCTMDAEVAELCPVSVSDLVDYLWHFAPSSGL